MLAHPYINVQRGEACEVVQSHTEVVAMIVADGVCRVDCERLKNAEAPQASQGRPVQAPAILQPAQA